MSAPKQQEESFIGKYRVVKFIGAGGMAEVWLCRRSGIGGFEKPVVIKRILPNFATDPEFVRMFLDEARVAASLNHQNIVQVYDIDTDDEVPFIAMEYVQGPSFHTMLSRARKAGSSLGLATAVRVVSDVAAGLDHAHNARDADGEPLGIVHRDISPHNILVGQDGVAKLLDFGVAKSRGRLSSTQAGTVKGKISHIAPEQAIGNDVDHRVDVYSLGVCLYEATTGRLPFLGDSDVNRMMQVVQGEYPLPSSLVPDYPAELEAIVVAAMQRDRDKRTQTAAALREQLERFSATQHFSTSHTGVAHKVAELFPSGVATSDRTPSNPNLSPPRGYSVGDGYRSPPRNLSTRDLEVINAANIRKTTGENPAIQATPPSGDEVDVDLQTRGMPTAVRPRPRWMVPAAALGVGLAVMVFAAIAFGDKGKPAETPEVAVPVALKAPAPTNDEPVRAQLSEARALIDQRRFEAALAALTQAKWKPATDAALNQQVTALLAEAESGLSVEKARNLLTAKDYDGALQLVTDTLSRHPGHPGATRLGDEVRTAKAAAQAPVAKKTPAPAKPAAAKPEPGAGGFDSESLLPSDPDSLLPPTKN